jgi:hypothetical protein
VESLRPVPLPSRACRSTAQLTLRGWLWVDAQPFAGGFLVHSVAGDSYGDAAGTLLLPTQVTETSSVSSVDTAQLLYAALWRRSVLYFFQSSEDCARFFSAVSASAASSTRVSVSTWRAA